MVSVNFAKMNILLDGAIIAKVNLSVMQRDARLFSWENMISNTFCLSMQRLQHEKTCLCHMRTTKVQISLRICTV